MPTYDVYLTSEVPRSERFEQGYDYMSGTSQATPFVSALAALLFSAHPDWDALQVERAIKEFVVDISAQNATLAQEGMLGTGRIDACRALGGASAAQPTAQTEETPTPTARPRPTATPVPVAERTPLAGRCSRQPDQRAGSKNPSARPAADRRRAGLRRGAGVCAAAVGAAAAGARAKEGRLRPPHIPRRRPASPGSRRPTPRRPRRRQPASGARLRC